ncbi:hypothetical protein AB0I37_30330 [Micromonospora purpureochromogenes]|uniref:hypothetical protein n=1 Tax=Micromonospora purpureochromogenes TaxID=47872 RepID=UPI0033E052F5
MGSGPPFGAVNTSASRRFPGDVRAQLVEFTDEITDEALAVIIKEAGALLAHLPAVDAVRSDRRRRRSHRHAGYARRGRPAATSRYPDGHLPVWISHVNLIEMHRDRRMYEWSVVARLPLHSDVPVSQAP